MARADMLRVRRIRNMNAVQALKDEQTAAGPSGFSDGEGGEEHARPSCTSNDSTEAGDGRWRRRRPRLTLQLEYLEDCRAHVAVDPVLTAGLREPNTCQSERPLAEQFMAMPSRDPSQWLSTEGP